MHTSSVLAALAFRFASHPENLATEALLHILERSVDMRHALAGIMSELNRSTAQPIFYRTQAAADDNTIPDLVGVDENGNEVLFIESKFWAGLTEAQPVGYLRRFRDHQGSLVFLTPARRLSTLWPELTSRCEQAGYTLADHAIVGERRAASINGHTVLAAVSWRYLLDHLHHTAASSGDVATSADILQLASLCEDMDCKGFLPLLPEELTGSLGTRVLQFCELVDDIAAALLRTGRARKDGVRATGSRGWYGHYMQIGVYGCLLAFSSQRWSEYGRSPIWLRIGGPTFKSMRSLGSGLASILATDVFQTEDGTILPILLPTGKSREEVVSAATTQVLAVASALEQLPPPIVLGGGAALPNVSGAPIPTSDEAV